MTKVNALHKLYCEYAEQFYNEKIVSGHGNINSSLLLIGEAPGKDEIRLGKPFVGSAGRNLTKFLDILGLGRDDVFITNAIKYRLSRMNEKSGRVINRPAVSDDINKSRGYLLKEIEILNSNCIVTLGNVPLRAVTGNPDKSIGKAHGEMDTIIISGKAFSLFPLYHPASVIYNRSLKDIYIEDIEKLRHIWDGLRGLEV